MLFSTSLLTLRIFVENITKKDEFLLQILHSVLNQLIQQMVFLETELRCKNFVQNYDFNLIKNQLYQSIELITKKDIKTLKNSINTTLDIILDQEHTFFISIYPQVMKIFTLITTEQKIPNEILLSQHKIEPDEMLPLLAIMKDFYENGEPIFYNYDNYIQNNKNRKDSDPINDQPLIRGRLIENILPDIINKYIHLDIGDAQVLWLPDLIVKGGYSFSEAIKISSVLESKGVIIQTNLFRDKNIEVEYSSIYEEKLKYSGYFLLNWEKMDIFLTKNIFCKYCGLPLINTNPVDTLDKLIINSCFFCKNTQ